MAVLRLIITAKAPLAFPSSKPGGQFRESLPYVPGSVLYGALGSIMAKQAVFPEELFRKIRCHNAYPYHEGDAWVRPLPNTAIQQKNASDAPIDSLVSRVCWEQQEPPALLFSPTDDSGRAFESAGAKFYTLREGITTRNVEQHLQTRVAIQRQTGTAYDQMLYSFLAINEASLDDDDELKPTKFLGSIVVPDNDVDDLQKALRKVRFVGARQSTGIGEIEIEAIVVEPEPLAVSERIEELSRTFQEKAETYQKLGGHGFTVKDRSIFTVNLLSDAVLLEENWLPTNEFSAAQLAQATGIKAKLLRSFASTSYISGWNVLWQRPKASQVAVRKGSVFVFQADQSLSDKECQRLAELEHSGIGERRTEGFGQVRICDDFHLLPVNK
jgi:CRISPR-associated protein Csx10